LLSGFSLPPTPFLLSSANLCFFLFFWNRSVTISPVFFFFSDSFPLFFQDDLDHVFFVSSSVESRPARDAFFFFQHVVYFSGAKRTEPPFFEMSLLLSRLVTSFSKREFSLYE